MINFRWQQRTEEEISNIGAWWVISLAGGGLIATGLLIAMFPAILVALIAGCIISAGIYVLSLGLALRPKEVAGGRGRRVEIHVPSADKRFSSTFEGSW